MQKNINGQQHEMSYLTGAEQDAMETVRRDPSLTQSLAEQGKEMQPRYENGISNSTVNVTSTKKAICIG